MGRRQARRKRCGMTAVAAPKICREREREREKEEGGKKEKRGEKGKKGRGEQERKMYYACGCKTPLRTVKDYKDKKGGAEKSFKKPEERKKRQKRPEKRW